MALTYDLTRVNDRKSLDNGRTEAMIFSTMIVGIGEINEQTVAKYFRRLYAYERVSGPIVQYADGRTEYTTPADVRRYLGLKTNVFGRRGPESKTDAQFAKDLARWAGEQADREWKRYEDQGDKLAQMIAG